MKEQEPITWLEVLGVILALGIFGLIIFVFVILVGTV